MSKSKIALLIVFIILVIAAIIVGLFLQNRSVTITANTSVDLFSGDSKIATVNGTQTLRLRDGEYCTVAIDAAYSKDKQCFMVFKQNKEVNIITGYSKEELASRLDGELKAIKTVVAARYAKIINQYTICKGELLGDGTWYGGVLRDKVASVSDGGNYYYFIMHKEDTWQLKATPSVVMSKISNETIPGTIVEYANTIQPCEAEVTSPENVPRNAVKRFETKQPIYTY